ncbi:NAD(P)-binding protein [Hypoxylon sp. NC1633]|nr:NAD(P)-binding protein [Hypoxylon sp. NC1633]
MDSSALFRVDGMVAVVTGGGSGLGFAMVRGLVGAGAKKVYILGRRRDVLDKAAAEHPNIVPVQCDIADKASLQSAVDFVTKDVGYINLFIANSGIYGTPNLYNNNLSIKELRKTLFEDHSVEDFNRTLNVNVTGTLFSIWAFLELLDAGNKEAVKGGFGAPTRKGSDAPSIQSQVIITSSIAGLSRMAFTAPCYVASKSALIHLTKHASTNLAKYSIRVNALAPGLFPSDMAAPIIGDRDASTETFDNPKFIPARKFGSDDEMAGSVLYLASKAGSFNNGFILLNDGGKSAIISSTY